MNHIEDELEVNWVDSSDVSCMASHQSDALSFVPVIHSAAEIPRLRYTSPPVDAPSEIVRNDVIFLSTGQVNRAWAERIYVGLRADDGRTDVVGFVHVRSKELLGALSAFTDAEHPVPALVEAYIACPPSLRPDDGGGHLIEDQLAQYLYGDPYVTVAVTPYCRPHRLLSGVCAHAAAHMCLALCCRRHKGGALGTFDIHRIACAGEGMYRNRIFGVCGLSPVQVAGLFSSSWAGLDGVYQVCGAADSYRGPGGRDRPGLYTQDAIGRSLIGLVDSDCPVVLSVHNDEWHNAIEGSPGVGGAGTEGIGHLDAENASGRRHGIVVLGYRIEPTAATTLIVHDSAVSAFMTVELHEALDAAEQFDPAGAAMASGVPNRVHIVAAAPKGVRIPPLQAGLEFWYLEQRARDGWPKGAAGRHRFLASASYKLVSIGDLAVSMAGMLNEELEDIPAAQDIQALLEDEGVTHMWRVTVTREDGLQAGLAAFVDASVPVVGRAQPAERLGLLVTVDLAQGIVLTYPDGRGTDSWLFDGQAGL